MFRVSALLDGAFFCVDKGVRLRNVAMIFIGQ